MEEICVNVEYDKPAKPTPSSTQTGPRSSERFYGAVVLCLGLLSVFLLAGLIALRVTYLDSLTDLATELSAVKANLTERLQASDDKLSSVSQEGDLLKTSLADLDRLQSLSNQNSLIDLAAELSAVKANLTERLQASDDKLSSLSQERDLLKTSLAEKTKELERLQSLSNQKIFAVKANLTERLQANYDKMSSVSRERNLLKTSLTEKTKELERLQSLSSQNRDSLHDLAAELSAVKANLTERLQASDDKLSSVSQERDLLKTSLAEKTKELERLQSLSNQKKTCPAGWTMFSSACYLLSTTSDSWEKGRKDCEDRGAHLVIINSYEEQEFLTKMIKNHTWIGLSDRDHEGTWKWIDGTPLTQAYWRERQPNGGGGDPQYGDEDCADILSGANSKGNWNDLRCDKSLQWICEKVA